MAAFDFESLLREIVFSVRPGCIGVWGLPRASAVDPRLRVALGLCVGVVAAGVTRGWPSTAVLAVLLACAALAVLRRAWGTAALLLAFVLTLCGLAEALVRRMWVEPGATLQVAGRVAGLPERVAEGARFELLRDDGARVPGGAAGPQRLRLTWYDAEPPLAGARCTLSVRLRPPRSFANPGGFDFEAWTLSRGIDAVGSVRAAPANHCVVQRAPRGVDAYRDALRRRLWATGLPSAGVIAALALGDGSGLTGEQWRTLRATGTVHLIVVSGLHVTLVAGVAFALARLGLRALPPVLRGGHGYRLAAAAGLLAAAAYGALAGLTVPTLRALAMALLALGARVLVRRQPPLPALLGAAAAVLLVQPLAWREPGAWLSFMGVGVMVWALAAERHAPRARALRFAHAWWATQWRMLLTATPLLVCCFAQAPLQAPFAALLAEPLLSFLCVPLALLGTVLLPVAAPLAWPLLRALDALLELFWRLLAWQLDHLGALQVRAVVALAPLLAGALLALAPRGFPARRLGLLVVALACALTPAPAAPLGEFRVTVYDVGQGTAALVETARHRVLVDTGPRFGPEFDAGDALIAPALLQAGHSRLDALVLSHADADHTGGMRGLLQHVRVGRVFAPDAAAAARPFTPCRAGVHWAWDGVRFAFLWPRDPLPARDNARSCVLQVGAGQVGGRRVGSRRVGSRMGALFPGDLDRRSEARLLDVPVDAAQFVLAPHHGSRSSSSPDFVAAFSPRTVVYTAAAPSRFGHPHPEVVARYAAFGAEGWVTGERGALVWSSALGEVSALRCAPRWRWQTPAPGCARAFRRR